MLHETIPAVMTQVAKIPPAGTHATDESCTIIGPPNLVLTGPPKTGNCLAGLRVVRRDQQHALVFPEGLNPRTVRPMRRRRLP